MITRIGFKTKQAILAMNLIRIAYIVLLLSISSYSTLQASDPPVNDMETLASPLMPSQSANMSLTLDMNAIIFNFFFQNDFQQGVGENGTIYTNGSINSNVRWELAFSANSDFQHTQGQYTIPADQVGVRLTLTGNYGNNKIKNNAKNHPKALQLSEVLLLEPRNKNKSNAGNNADIAFTIYWQMGTRNGNMNNLSIDGGAYQYGQYHTNVTFVLREAM